MHLEFQVRFSDSVVERHDRDTIPSAAGPMLAHRRNLSNQRSKSFPSASSHDIDPTDPAHLPPTASTSSKRIVVPGLWLPFPQAPRSAHPLAWADRLHLQTLGFLPKKVLSGTDLLPPSCAKMSFLCVSVATNRTTFSKHCLFPVWLSSRNVLAQTCGRQRQWRVPNSIALSPTRNLTQLVGRTRLHSTLADGCRWFLLQTPPCHQLQRPPGAGKSPFVDWLPILYLHWHSARAPRQCPRRRQGHPRHPLPHHSEPCVIRP